MPSVPCKIQLIKVFTFKRCYGIKIWTYATWGQNLWAGRPHSNTFSAHLAAPMSWRPRLWCGVPESQQALWMSTQLCLPPQELSISAHSIVSHFLNPYLLHSRLPWIESCDFIIIWAGFVMLCSGEQEMEYPGLTQQRLFPTIISSEILETTSKSSLTLIRGPQEPVNSLI